MLRSRRLCGVKLFLATAMAAVLAFAQSFEVASIKPSAPDSNTETRRYPGGRFTATGVTLKALIQRAYDVQPFQIAGGPKWLSSDRFDIAAKAGEEFRADQPLNPLIQALLADRFGLKLHHENREMPLYSLVVDKGGPKLQPNSSAGGSTWTYGRGLLKGNRVSLSMLASDLLQKALERPVTDHTGIPGNFDLQLTWAPEEVLAAPDGEPGPSLFNAIREQLGLRLEAQRGPVEILVIDSAEKPKEN